MSFKNPIVVAVAIVPIFENNQFVGVLGVRRNNEPFRGEIALPGGYQNEMELSRSAAVRELFEETGLIVDATKCQFFDEKMTPLNRNLQFWECEPISMTQFNRLTACPVEVQEIVIINHADQICFPTHQEVFTQYMQTVQLERSDIILDVKK